MRWCLYESTQIHLQHAIHAPLLRPPGSISPDPYGVWYWESGLSFCPNYRLWLIPIPQQYQISERCRPCTSCMNILAPMTTGKRPALNRTLLWAADIPNASLSSSPKLRPRLLPRAKHQIAHAERLNVTMAVEWIECEPQSTTFAFSEQRLQDRARHSSPRGPQISFHISRVL